MSNTVYLPADEFGGADPQNDDLAADYLELKAVFSRHGQSFRRDIVKVLDLADHTPFDDVNGEMEALQDVATAAVNRMESRKRALATAYPFELDEWGDVVRFTSEIPDFGQTAYLVSLLLSNLRTVTPLLSGSQFHPSQAEVLQLRRFFQNFATAAIAAEIGGPAWSFGFPRPDRSGFFDKLSEIWADLRDGTVGRDPSAPSSPKDDKVDIFAWREQRDGLPGFLLVAAQVATGKDWMDKSIQLHINRTFKHRWFSRPPVTEMVAYHVIPFARPDRTFRDDVSIVGNLLHRLRVPRRVAEADGLVRKGVAIEAFDQLGEARNWIRSHIDRARSARDTDLIPSGPVSQ